MNDIESHADHADHADHAMFHMIQTGIPEFAAGRGLGDAALRRAGRRRTTTAVSGTVGVAALAAVGLTLAAPAHKSSTVVGASGSVLTASATHLGPLNCPQTPPTVTDLAAAASRVPGADKTLAPRKPVAAIECLYGYTSASVLHYAAMAPGSATQVASLVTDLAGLSVQPGTGDHSCPAGTITEDDLFVLQYSDGSTLMVGQGSCHWLTDGLVYSTASLPDHWTHSPAATVKP